MASRPGKFNIEEAVGGFEVHELDTMYSYMPTSVGVEILLKKALDSIIEHIENEGLTAVTANPVSDSRWLR